MIDCLSCRKSTLDFHFFTIYSNTWTSFYCFPMDINCACILKWFLFVSSFYFSSVSSNHICMCTCLSLFFLLECRVSYIDKYNSGELTGRYAWRAQLYWNDLLPPPLSLSLSFSSSCQKVSILDKLLYYSPNYEVRELPLQTQ